MIGQVVSHYKILEKLGEGGMGEVYLAEDTELERKVALKFLPPHFGSDPEILARFKHEAKAAAALNHPNIVTVYEVGQHDDRPFIAMAYVEGDLLTDLIARKDIPIKRVLDIVGQIADGLGKAHEAGIVHRDVKPDNIFVDHDGRVKILDFGLATQKGVTRVTKHESTLGTLYYMSPEQTRADEADHRSDIFSLGVVLYEMIAGQAPFQGEHSAAVLYSIANDTPQPLSRYNNQVTLELERIISKALAKKREDRYQSTADFSVDLKHAFDDDTRAPKPSKNVLKYVLPTSAVFVIALLVLIFKPFSVEITPDQTAQAGANKLAIMYFENMAQPQDPGRMGEIVTDLLITNLSRTEDLQVVSSQRLYDILKLKGQEGAKVIDRSTSTEVARDAGAKWMMLGRILQVEPVFVVSSQLIDMATGDVVTSQRVTGAPGETIFEIVDRMTGETKGELHIPIEKGIEQEISVADVTTNSLEAYKYYLEGEEYMNRLFRPEARESYRKAIAADSTFAMAYLKLSSASFGSSLPDAVAALNQAVKYSSRASEKEQLYIKAIQGWFEANDEQALALLEEIIERYPEEKDAYSLLAQHHYTRDNFEEAIEGYSAVVRMDPMDKLSYNQLAYAYDGAGNFDKSIWAINKYIELAPDEPNPYDTRGDLYAFNGHVEKALESYKKAEQIKPDFFDSVEKAGHMYLFMLDDSNAETQYRKLVGSGDARVRSRGRLLLANVHLYRGRWEEGLAQMDAGISADEMERFTGFDYITKFFSKSGVYTALEDYDRAMQEMDRALPMMEAIIPPQFAVLIRAGKAAGLAANKRLDEARELLAELEAEFEGVTNPNLLKDYYVAQGAVAYEGGEFSSACEFFEKSNEIEERLLARYSLADAYLKAGRTEEAIALFEKILKRHDPSRIASPTLSVRVHYLLGGAYEKMGQPDKAAEQYRRFLAIWKDSESGLKEITETKARLSALQASG